MRLVPLLVPALLGACRATEAPKQIALSSQRMTLPSETATLPADILTVNCAACHSPEMILTQPRLEPGQWQAEVTKMRAAYKASIDEQDDAQIVAALLVLPNQK